MTKVSKLLAGTALAGLMMSAGPARAAVYDFTFFNFTSVVIATGSFETGGALAGQPGFEEILRFDFTAIANPATGRLTPTSGVGAAVTPGGGYNPTTDAFVNVGPTSPIAFFVNPTFPGGSPLSGAIGIILQDLAGDVVRFTPIFGTQANPVLGPSRSGPLEVVARQDPEVPIPEPMTAALLGAGLLGLGLIRRAARA